VRELEEPGLEKEEIRLPDGRRLIFYTFPDAKRRPDPPSPAADPPAPRGRKGA
jgi:hypothetical protein